VAFWTNDGREVVPRLVWLIDARYSTPAGAAERMTFGVDAENGELRYATPETFGLNRTAWSMNYNSANFPNSLTWLWNEGFPSSAVPAALSAYQLSQKPWLTWADVLMQYDDFEIVAHHPASHSSWYSFASPTTHWLLFGDFMAYELDAVAHEYGHGIYRPKMGPAPYKWWDEYHAANEFYGDLSAVVTDIRDRGGAIEHTWKITSDVVRNLKAPTTVVGDFRDWYPNRRFVGLSSSVAYSNSTIFGHALYLLISGGYHARVGGSAHPNSGTIPAILVNPTNSALVLQIFGVALLDMSIAGTPMNGPNLRAATVAAASTVAGATVAANVGNAWAAVGIGHACSAPPSVPTFEIQPEFCRGRHTITWSTSPNVKYHGELVRHPYSFDVADSVVDGTMNSCVQNVGGLSRFRMRACNACGCSAWSLPSTMQYYPICY